MKILNKIHVSRKEKQFSETYVFIHESVFVFPREVSFGSLCFEYTRRNITLRA